MRIDDYEKDRDIFEAVMITFTLFWLMLDAAFWPLYLSHGHLEIPILLAFY